MGYIYWDVATLIHIFTDPSRSSLFVLLFFVPKFFLLLGLVVDYANSSNTNCRGYQAYKQINLPLRMGPPIASSSLSFKFNGTLPYAIVQSKTS
jgi:hypothetical protein